MHAKLMKRDQVQLNLDNLFYLVEGFEILVFEMSIFKSFIFYIL